MAIKDGLLPEFDHEMALTRKTLERVPDDKLGWKPHPKSFSMGSLAMHIANMAGWTYLTMTNDSFDIQPPGAPPYKEEPVQSTKELLEKFDTGVVSARAAIAGTGDEAFMKQWSLLKEGQTLFTMPRIACLRSMIMNHTIHHRAQLGVYLRMNDIPVPATYGPSADEMQ
jgi:uncharacterized damage-inducible protein DinB